MEANNDDVIRGPLAELYEDVMKNATDNFGHMSVPLASFAPMMSPK
jgi:hypothetical protein